MGVLDRELREGQIFYRVSWKGYDIKESTWEPRSNLIIDAPQLVNQVEIAQKPDCEWKKHCICKGFDDGTLMMHCVGCKEWFHASCVGVDLNDTDPSEIWRI